MSGLWARFAALFSNRTFVGMDKIGNRYFFRKEQVDGIMKEKRWVIFKGEQDPTSIPVEWICWLNGQRKKAPTPEEMAELDARREHVRLNVARLKEEERKAKEGQSSKIAAGPDLEYIVQQFRTAEEGNQTEAAFDSQAVRSDKSSGASAEQKKVKADIHKQPKNSEPTGSGESFRPGTWQPPS